MEIDLPTTTTGRITLSKAIKEKVTADGVGGECAKFIIAQNIDVDADVTNAEAALVHEIASAKLFRLGEKNNAEAHVVFDKINTVSRAISQELKNLNAPNYINGNDWGFDFSASGAAHFPTTQADQITLFQAINTHYLTFAAGTASIEPLLVKRGWVMATLTTQLTGAVTQKNDSKQNFRDSESETAARNEDMSIPEINIHKFANFLHSRHQDDARTLGDYGFDTSDAPTKERDQISTIDMASEKQLDHIVLNSIMTSMVNIDLMVYNGQTTDSPGEKLPAYGELAMGKGYSHCIVVCLDPLKKGIVKVRVGR
ncbi:MAG: hypothetical protein WCL14_02740 [Bacteroidota bacterium]